MSSDSALLPVFMPAPVEGRPPEPVPFVMTEEDVARFLRLTSQDPYKTLHRYRQMGLLKGTQIGLQIRYQLPDVLEFLKLSQASNPR